MLYPAVASNQGLEGRGRKRLLHPANIIALYYNQWDTAASGHAPARVIVSATSSVVPLVTPLRGVTGCRVVEMMTKGPRPAIESHRLTHASAGRGEVGLRTIIHIGQHKTGTTSLQHYLQYHREDLSDRGLYVPESVCGYDHPSHFILNVYSLNQNRFSSMKEKLLASESPEFFRNLPGLLAADIERHYQEASSQACKDVLWSNEGLYLLNSVEEYTRLFELFSKYSDEIVCVCSFREMESYRTSHRQTIINQGLPMSNDKDSYRYFGDDSWLFDYDRKKQLLSQVFDDIIYLSYNREDMVRTFMEALGYSVSSGTESIRLNVTR
jgi:hypothetical protein